MNKRLSLELLQKVNNPSHMFTDLEPDEEGSVPNVPQRISSRLTARPKPPRNLHVNSDIQAIDEANNAIHRPGMHLVFLFNLFMCNCFFSCRSFSFSGWWNWKILGYFGYNEQCFFRSQLRRASESAMWTWSSFRFVDSRKVSWNHVYITFRTFPLYWRY